MLLCQNQDKQPGDWQPEMEISTMSEYPKPDEQVELLLRQGYELWNKGQHAQAFAAYDKAVQIKPDSVDAWYYRGYKLEELQRYREALADYDEVLRLAPKHPYAWYRRGILLLTRLERYDEAMASYDKVLEIDPNDYDAWYGRGDALAELKRYPEAVESYKKAIHINPTNCWDWCERLQKLQDVQLEQSALLLCQEIATVLDKMDAETDPEHSWVWDSIHQSWHMLGDFLLGLQRYAEAAAAYDKAIQIKPDECLSWYGFAKALEQLQRYEEALNCYDRAMQINPDFQEASKGRERVLGKIKN